MGYTDNRKRGLLGAAALSAFIWLGAGAAAAEPGGGGIELQIEAGPLGDVLRTISLRTGTPVIFSEELVAGRRAPALSGTYAGADAVRAVLAGSGLVAAEGRGGGLRIEEASAPARPETPEVLSARPAERAEAQGAAEADLRFDQVTVTGTSLRGFAPESSPLLVFGRDEILRSGVATAEEFIRKLPQNFGGGSSEFVPAGLPNDSSSRSNYSFGTGANLRGLGSGGTLVLLNGHRMAPTSAIGDFVDLSLIPVSALARVDVLTDGASSIYGGDAVAGVINFVLREDFEGAETSLRYGSVTQGDMQELRISQALGTVWNSGNILATAEYSSRDNLVLADRPDIAAPSASAGGAAGLFDLMPEQERWSGVIVANQSLTPSLDVSASALYTKRTVANSSYTTFRTTSDTESETSTLNLSADYAPTDRWSVSGGVTFSSLTNDELLTTFRTSPPVPAKSSFGSEIRAADLLVNGDLFDLPGGTVKLALGGHLRSEDFYFDTQRLGRISEGERDVAALYGEILLPVVGPDNAMRGIRRLELNLSGRRDDYSDFGSTFNPKAGLLWSPAEGLNLRSSYSTSFTPPPLGRVGDQNRSGVVYPYTFILNTFGWQAPDPSLVGTDYLIWAGAFNDLEPETSRTFTGGADFEVSQGAHKWTLRSTYYDIRFEDRLGSTPIPNSQNVNFAPSLAFTDPGLFPAGTVLFFPSQAEVDALVASFSRPVALLLGASLNNIGIINNASAIRNLAATETQGLDLSLGFERDASFGRISAGLNANYILDFSQQAATSTPSVTTLNTLYNPVDLKLRANLGLSAGGFAGSLFVNHTDRYRTEDTPAARDIGAWTTADMNLAYAFEGSSARWLEGTSISLSVLNLFDVSPPRTPTNSGFRLAGYDPTNASPLGRFVAVELRKTF